MIVGKKIFLDKLINDTQSCCYYTRVKISLEEFNYIKLQNLFVKSKREIKC